MRLTSANGSFVWDSNCNKVSAATVTQAANGDVSITFTGTGTFYIGIKFDSGSVKGENAPGGSGTIHYDFEILGVASSKTGLDLIKKP